jgi:cob(I)alamin adenosyltransferase
MNNRNKNKEIIANNDIKKKKVPIINAISDVKSCGQQLRGKGYVQLYYGNGKGKTTAAMGLALRAAGCGLKVYIAQFVKGMKYSELTSLEKLKNNITVKQYGRGCFIRRQATEKDIQAAQKGLSEVRKTIMSGKYDMVILDEITIAEYFKLISVEDILDVIASKPDHMELVLTGRKADSRIIDAADLVTEMVEIKHYYNVGIEARKGIEK